ncbi:DUF998 domain-containing protein [Spongiactinospora sp. TRM90649]|uniref:DUF998 domain-containing protein n=1 Tax=Spongiactinospora sp. TRM90649 TaxID=3031114 RepID=UPI0023F7F568|nr:DUF998 domain-containing protein [Spongiactinospora sp. TRM90649]MDF5754483.1 DUF998 domain-containing protein [Spongiactinospora sp. TRM90649]
MTAPRWLLACGVAGPVLFVVAFLVEGATRADYDPLRHPVSALALGDLGWTQVTNFVVTGLLVLALAAGLRGHGLWPPLLLALVGLGLIGAGIFPTDPVGDYPPGVPAGDTATGNLHNAFSLPVFVALPGVCCVLAYRFATSDRLRLAAYSVLTAVAMLALFVLAGLGFSGDPGFTALGGLMQRLSLVTGFAWLVFLAVHELRLRASSDRVPAG